MNLHTWTGWGSVTHWNGFVWDGLNSAGLAAASGVYFYCLLVGETAKMQKMVLVH